MAMNWPSKICCNGPWLITPIKVILHHYYAVTYIWYLHECAYACGTTHGR